MRVVRVSGTIKKSEEEAIRRDRIAILRAKGEMEGKSAGTLEALLGPAERKDGTSASRKRGKGIASIEDVDDKNEEGIESGSDEMV